VDVKDHAVLAKLYWDICFPDAGKRGVGELWSAAVQNWHSSSSQQVHLLVLA